MSETASKCGDSILRKPEITDGQRHLTCQRLIRNIVHALVSIPDGELEDHEGRLMAAVSRAGGVEHLALESELFAARQALSFRVKVMEKRAELQGQAGNA